jgi:riboflavin kinase/FMN adenylyltransferase
MRRKPPVRGILAARVYGIDPEPLMAVVSLGTRPTVDGTDMLLEVHVFDFEGDLYGREIEVEFVAKLRDEVKFDSLDALKRQMKIDAAQARNLLAKVNSG